MARDYVADTFTTTNVSDGEVLSKQASGTKKMTRVTFTGTYAGAAGTVQGSMDGTNYIDLTGVREDSGARFTGTIGAANFAVLVNTGGWQYVRFTPTALGSGTLGVALDFGASFDLPIGVVPVSLSSVATTITGSSSNAFCVGPNGTTNPSFNVDASAGSAATGVQVTAGAAAGGVAVAAISSGTNENLTLDAKGSGTVTINGTGTGAITLGAATGVTGAITGTSTSASALTVGANGATNPVLKVDANTASVATGVSITGAAAAGRVAVAAISSGTNEGLDLNAKGSGTIRVGNSSTGNVLLGGGGGLVVASGTLTAGGSLTCGVQVATSGPLLYSGSGAPTISAAVKGSLYMRTDGSSTSTRAYVATDTAGTWASLTASA